MTLMPVDKGQESDSNNGQAPEEVGPVPKEKSMDVGQVKTFPSAEELGRELTDVLEKLQETASELKVTQQQIGTSMESLQDTLGRGGRKEPESVSIQATGAIRRLASGTTQEEILQVFLQEAKAQLARVILFSRDEEKYVSWRSAGFDSDRVTKLTLVDPDDPVVRAADHRTMLSFEAPLAEIFSWLPPVPEPPLKAVCIPLVFNDFVPLVLYGDSDSDLPLDFLELLSHLAVLVLKNNYLQLMVESQRGEAAAAEAGDAGGIQTGQLGEPVSEKEEESGPAAPSERTESPESEVVSAPVDSSSVTAESVVSEETAGSIEWAPRAMEPPAEPGPGFEPSPSATADTTPEKTEESPPYSAAPHLTEEWASDFEPREEPLTQPPDPSLEEWDFSSTVEEPLPGGVPAQGSEATSEPWETVIEQVPSDDESAGEVPDWMKDRSPVAEEGAGVPSPETQSASQATAEGELNGLERPWAPFIPEPPEERGSDSMPLKQDAAPGQDSQSVPVEMENQQMEREAGAAESPAPSPVPEVPESVDFRAGDDAAERLDGVPEAEAERREADSEPAEDDQLASESGFAFSEEPRPIEKGREEGSEHVFFDSSDEAGPAPVLSSVEDAPVEPAPAPESGSQAAAGEGAFSLSAEELERYHHEARRFARLLVSEIKLYNEEAVESGRAHSDLHRRLQTDIERSREMYQKRVHPGVRSLTDHFHDQLVRILAQGEERLLGSDYPGPVLH
ncbi:MAG: hypothetical protein ACE5JX_04505 [Acidobacteriota bacterium]